MSDRTMTVSDQLEQYARLNDSERSFREELEKYPLVKGGQGRTPDSLKFDALSVFWMVAALVMLAVVLFAERWVMVSVAGSMLFASVVAAAVATPTSDEPEEVHIDVHG